MANIEITTNTVRSLVLRNAEYNRETLVATEAVTWAKGTLLGRVTASSKLTAYVSGNSDGSEVPVAVLPVEVEFTAAGDKYEDVIVSGVLREVDLVAYGVGDITAAEKDLLRDYGIVSIDSTELSELDNQ